MKANERILKDYKSYMLALNIPTYVTLYGYGYRNIYELDELLSIDDLRIKFGGFSTKKIRLRPITAAKKD